MFDRKKLLISSSVKKTVRESVLFAERLGVGIEISRIPLYKTEGMTVQDVIASLKQDLEGFKGRKTLHAMFSDVNIASPDYEVKAFSKKRYIQSFETAAAIGADTVLFHSGYKGTKHNGSIYCFKKNYTEFWKDFIKEFEKRGMTAVVENVFESDYNFDFELAERIASDNFKLALDTGHVNIYAPDTNVCSWIRKYGKNLHHMHIHNNFKTNDDHSNLLNGTLNFKEIFECVKEEKISPSMVFEMFSEDDVIKSAEFMNIQF